MKILLINQNATVEKLVKLSAQKVGLEVESVDSLDVAGSSEYKWVLIDHDNLQNIAPEELKAKFLGSKIGLLYPKNSEKSAGFDLYIEKPFLPTELIDEFSSQMGDGDAGGDELGSLDMELPDLDDGFADLPDSLGDDFGDDTLGEDLSFEERGSVLDKEEVDKVKELLSDDDLGEDLSEMPELSTDESVDLGDELAIDDSVMDLGEMPEVALDNQSDLADDISQDMDLGDTAEVATVGEEIGLDDDLSIDDSTLDMDLSFDEKTPELGEISDDSLEDKSLDMELGGEESLELDSELLKAADSGDEISLDESFGEQGGEEASELDMGLEEESLNLEEVAEVEESATQADDVDLDDIALDEADYNDKINLDLGDNTALLDEDDLMDLQKDAVLEDNILDDEEFGELGALEEIEKEVDLEDHFEPKSFDFTEQPSDELETLSEESIAEALGEAQTKPDILDIPTSVTVPAAALSEEVLAGALGNISTSMLKEILDGMQLTINISFPNKK